MSPDADRTTPAAGDQRVLLAYFSRAGENYYYGGRRTLKVGNTAVLARLIADRIDCDVFEITAADPYPTDYEQTVARNVREEQQDARPEIDGSLPSLDGYDTVLLGSPVWNVQTPMIMRTFVEALDFGGKAVHPFVTYAVSRMGDVRSDYRRLLPNATITQGLAVQGETVNDAAADAAGWLDSLDLPRK